ncbi:MAG: CPBP family intramembrane metalloprotease [Hyphomonadaceae bacterium]|nr:CPBP family intramembrane metalloprotease [Hyphomonadaceae bacterium]
MNAILVKTGETILLIGFALALLAIPILAVRFWITPGIGHLLSLDADALSVTRRMLMIFAFIGGYWLFVRIAEKRRAAELALRPTTIALSGLGGAAAIAVPTLVLFGAGAYSVSGIGSGNGWAMIALVIFAAALLEEILFRAILFRIVLEKFGFWIALILPSILFSCLHLFNDQWAGWHSIISVVLLGIMWSLIFALTRNIWAAAANHALWNFTIFASGLPLTGQSDWRASAPLQSEPIGADLWTGGASGPEASVIVIAWLFGIVGALLWLCLKRRLHQQAD